MPGNPAFSDPRVHLRILRILRIAGLARIRRLSSIRAIRMPANALLSLTALLLVLASCAGRQQLAPISPVAACRDPARTVRQFAWDSHRHQTIAHTFDALPGPPNAGPRLAARLDRLADAWAAARTASCTAHRRRALSSDDMGARIACQNAVLLQQTGLIERVVAAPAAALARADAGIDELEDSLRRCERPPVMALYRGPRPLVAARIELAQADVAIALGDGSWAQAVAHAARGPDVDPAIAERLRLPVQIALTWGSWLRGQDLKASTRLTEISPGEDRFAAAALAELRLLTRGVDDPEALADGTLALTAYRELLGPADRRLVRIHRELARRRRLTGDLAGAVTETDAALAILRDPEDPLHAALTHELGDLEHLRGDYRNALLHHRAALVARERAFGADQLPTAESQFGVGSDHEALGELPAAIKHYVLALETQRTLAPDDLATARTFNNLGRAFYADRNFEGSRKFHDAALAIRRRVLGEHHPDVATSLNNLGAVARAEGDLAAAMKLFQQSLDLRERLLGADHPATAISLNNIAEIFVVQGDLGRALALHERALKIRRLRFGEDHPETARSLHNIGVLQMDRGDLDAAEQALTAAAKIRGLRLGPEHPETLGSLERLKELATRREQADAREQAAQTPEPTPTRKRGTSSSAGGASTSAGGASSSAGGTSTRTGGASAGGTSRPPR